MDGTGTFHDGFSARGHQCRVHLSGESLHLYFTDDNSNYLEWDLRSIVSCHLTGQALIIKYGEYPHQTLECSGDPAKEIYSKWSSGSISRTADRISFRSNTVMALVLILGFILLIVFGWFVALPWTGEKAAGYIPLSTEIALGDNIAGAYTANSDVDDTLTSLVQDFADELRLTDEYKVRVTVLRSDEINAFALPGGRIFVYSGILDHMHNYRELVALLGHEVTHVTHRHSLKSICRSAAGGIFIATLFGDVTGISSGILSQADQFKQLDYSRQLETEADDQGLQLMMKNRVSGQGMVDLLELLKREGAEMPALMKYLSSHPETSERIKNIRGQEASRRTFADNETLRNIFARIRRQL